MDRTRTSAVRTPKKWILPALLVVGLTGVAGYYFSAPPTVAVEEERLTITTVGNDQFYEYLNLNGTVEPTDIYFLDSKVAGNIEQIYVSTGQEVDAGDTLLRITNADLELEVMQRESQLVEQLNAQRQTRLLLDQNDFTRREQLVEVSYQLAGETQRYQRAEVLLADSLIAVSEYEPIANQYAYFQRRRQLLAASFRADSINRRVQVTRIDAFEGRLLANLGAVRNILDRLYVRAPVAGRLSDFDLVAGQAITSGQRLGQLYDLRQPEIICRVDEFYLNKVTRGQRGVLLDGTDSIQLTVRKVFPDVENGRFRVAIVFSDALPNNDLVRGQNLRVRLFFGEAAPTTVLANGAFYGSTGGNWVYLVRDGEAVRTAVRLGRSNPNYYEVLEGLLPGDRVITSNYDNFKDYPTLTLN